MNVFDDIKNRWSLVKNNPYAMGNAAMGLGSLGLQVGNLAQGRNLHPQAPERTMDAYGRPGYNLGRFAGEVQAFQPKGAGIGDVLAGAGTGAAIGGPLGAAIGAATTFVGGLFGESAEEERKR